MVDVPVARRPAIATVPGSGRLVATRNCASPLLIPPPKLRGACVAAADAFALDGDVCCLCSMIYCCTSGASSLSRLVCAVSGAEDSASSPNSSALLSAAEAATVFACGTEEGMTDVGFSLLPLLLLWLPRCCECGMVVGFVGATVAKRAEAHGRQSAQTHSASRSNTGQIATGSSRVAMCVPRLCLCCSRAASL
jgi:hypothetical protein